jgi:hypothetical protein
MRRMRRMEVLMLSLASAFAIGMAFWLAVDFSERSPAADAVTEPLPVEGAGIGSVTPGHDRR